MARTKQSKKEIIEKLGTLMDSATSMVFVNFHGLKVADATAIRRKLREEGVGFFVAKKSLTTRALEDKKYAGSIPTFPGEFGMVYGKDLISPAREIYQFQKKHKDSLAIVGGVFEGKYMTADEMVSIASIPSQNVLYGMFVNIINSPIQGFVIALSEIAKKKTA